MDLEHWQRIKSLRFAASELSGDDRDRFLSANCGSPEERSEVEQGLEAAAPSHFMNAPVLGERPAIVDLHPGDRFGRYQIQELLGAGGGGKVYRALDPTLRRTVAIKILPPSMILQESDRRRFQREAEAASALNHPNIITVYEIGIENGIDFIAMEYIAGKSLRDSISKRGLKLSQFFPWAIQIADALAAAHKAGVVHRDLKPGNIMLTDRGTAKVVDFGIAKATRLSDEGTAIEPTATITKEGMLTGTFAYMSPEQAQGKSVDSRSDIFSLGCVLYEMLCGQRAFSGSPLTVIARVVDGEPPPLKDLAPEVPKGIEQLIVQCLRKDPADRWQNAADIRLVLEQLHSNWQAGEVAVRAQRSAKPWVLLGALALVLLTLAGAAYWYGRRTITPGPEFRLIALTTDAGLSTAPSLSADGRMLAFASDRSGQGNLDIWVQQISGHAPIRLTNDPADETDPDISPDGTRVVFRSEKDGGGIYMIPALGGEPSLLAQGGRNPRFSPDGASVAYWVGSEQVQLSPGAALAYIIAAGGGHPRPVGDLVASMYPIWSPDGKALLVLGRKTTNFTAEQFPDWWVVPTEGGTPKPTQLTLETRFPALRHTRSHGHYVPLAWSADSGVVFAAQLGDAANLWSIAIDSKSARFTGEPRRLTSGTGSELYASFAAGGEGNRMAFTSLALRFDLWAQPIDEETGMVRNALHRLTSNLSPSFYPSVSWDGSKVAFIRQGAVNSLCVLDTNTGKETTLLTSALSYAFSRISGDGQWVTFGEFPATVSRIASRGGTVTRICENCGNPIYSSFDGGKALIAPASPPLNVRQIDVASGKISTLVQGRERLYSADLTRDGKWVTFHANENGGATSRIFVARINGDQAVPPSEWIPITEADSISKGPRWSPKANILYYLSNRDGFRCIWARRLDPMTKIPSGPAFAVLHLHHPERSLQHLARFDDSFSVAVSPGMLTIAAGELTGNIWLRDSKVQ